MSRRRLELEERRRALVVEARWQRRRLQGDAKVADHWIRLARMIVTGARRASRLYRYWNHATQP